MPTATSDEAAPVQDSAPVADAAPDTTFMSDEERQKLRAAKLAEILAERGDVEVSPVDGRARITCRKFARTKGTLGIAFLAEDHVKNNGRTVMRTEDEWEAAYEAFLQAPR